MQSKAITPDQYMKELPDERKSSMQKLRAVIKKNLPKGFEEQMSYGMIGYVVPHKMYPPGYHVDPKLPLGLMAIASQKNYIALYHMGIYADQKLLKWFTSEYAKAVTTKLDMGKSCIRFKKPEQIPFELVGELVKRISLAEWIALYERSIPK